MKFRAAYLACREAGGQGDRIAGTLAKKKAGR
jgi:hypothetical protein